MTNTFCEEYNLVFLRRSLVQTKRGPQFVEGI